MLHGSDITVKHILLEETVSFKVNIQIFTTWISFFPQCLLFRKSLSQHPSFCKHTYWNSLPAHIQLYCYSGILLHLNLKLDFYAIKFNKKITILPYHIQWFLEILVNWKTSVRDCCHPRRSCLHCWKTIPSSDTQ